MSEEKMKKLSENIQVPETLSPDNIEKMLNEQSRKKKSSNKFHFTKGMTAAAACLLVLITAGSTLFATGILKFDKNALERSSSAPSKTVGTNNAGATTYEDLREKIFNQLDTYTNDDDTVYEESAEISSSGSQTKNSIAESAVTDSASDSSSTTNSNTSPDYTHTNIQENGVDEGDVVKTDGTYIYSYSEDAFGNCIKIVKADGTKTKLISTINVNNIELSELYITENHLVALGTLSNSPDDSTGHHMDKTKLLVYDLTDINKPVLTFEKKQSGYYSNSRMVGNYLYTMSNMQVYSANEDDEKQNYIPTVDDTVVTEDKLYCPPDASSTQYLVFTALDITGNGTFSDSLSVLGGEGICYVSENNIYIATNNSIQNTTISKFSYKDGQLSNKCEKSFKGTILNQFSMDEYNGCLRFVATTYSMGTTSNGLYVMDENLERIGSVSNLAKSERIYSARFLGNSAYFVTYRETDPVFYVDLSDPKNPVVKDHLKIPGFSTYLHPYGDNLLLGIGSEDVKSSSHVKLSMFDITKGANLTEQNKLLLDADTASSAGNVYKSVLVDTKRNRIGFFVSSYSDASTYFVLYSYDKKKGFQQIAKLSPDPNGSPEYSRGMFIGKYFYLTCSGYMTCVYDTDSMKLVKEVDLP